MSVTDDTGLTARVSVNEDLLLCFRVLPWFICFFPWQTILEVIMMRYVPNASEDFLAELDRNEPARDRFYALSQQEQQRILEQAHSVRDVFELRALVDRIRA